MVQMGRYGDTRVPTRVLFDTHDPDSPGPPANAIDIQFRAPLTVSLLLQRSLDGPSLDDGPGLESVLRFLGPAYGEVVAATVNKLQFVAGYVAEDSLSWPARLEITTETHLHNNNDETDIRLHDHVWVARTAVGLHDGVRRPVDLDGMQISLANVVWSTYLTTLRQVTSRELGVSWRSPRPGAAAEITDPPVHVGLTGREDLGICTAPWGPREMWEQPTRDWLALSEQLERYAARDIERGVSSWVPPDQPRRANYFDEPDSW